MDLILSRSVCAPYPTEAQLDVKQISRSFVKQQIDSFSGSHPLLKLPTRGVSHKQAYLTCNELLQKAHDMIFSGESVPTGHDPSLFFSGSYPVGDLIRLLEVIHVSALSLPKQFRNDVLQKEIDLALSILDEFWSSANAARYNRNAAAYFDTLVCFEKFSAYYQKTLAPLTSTQDTVKPIDMGVEYREFLSEAQKEERLLQPEQWQDILLMGSYINISPAELCEVARHRIDFISSLRNQEMFAPGLSEDPFDRELEFLRAYIERPSDYLVGGSSLDQIQSEMLATEGKGVVDDVSSIHLERLLETYDLDRSDWDNLVSQIRLYRDLLSSYPSMASSGMNFIYGPVCDTGGSAVGEMEKTERLYAHDPVVSSLLARVTIETTTQSFPRTGFVIKHAPGIGTVMSNPEWNEMLVDERSRDQILSDLSAFTSTIVDPAANVAVMVSGVAYPQIEEDPKMKRPACLSPAVCDLIRDNVGQDVVLVSDDLGTPSFIRFYTGVPQLTNWDNVVQYSANAIVDAANAGIDSCLIYIRNADTQTRLLDQLVTLAEGENISRTALEASVMRILKLKQRMFPDAVALQDLDETVHNMSLRQLWAQKLIYPVWTPAHTRQFVQEGVGGVSFEGIASNEVYRRTIQTELEANPDLIPPFLANNSPQEKTERHSSSNPAFLAEKQQLKSIAALCENIFPLGFPPEVANALILASQGQ